MRYSARIAAASLLVLTATLPAWLPAAQPPANPAPATRPPDNPPPTPKPPAAAPTDPFRVPEGTVEQLFDFIATLDTLVPEASDPATVATFQRKAYTAALEAASKILAARPTAEQAADARDYRFMSLLELLRLGQPGAGAELSRMIDEARKAGNAQAARGMEGSLLQAELGRAMLLPAAQMPALITRVAAHIEAEAADPQSLQLALFALEVLQQRDMIAQAAALARQVSAHCAGSKDKVIAAYGSSLANVARRLELGGKPLELEGQFLDGRPFRWEDYRGKTVLIVFWLTTAPVAGEFATYRELLSQYGAKGFAIVGVSSDTDREALEKFIAAEKIPWGNLFHAQSGSNGPHPMAERYGVLSYPTTILVGSDGKVAALNVTGAKLRAELERLLGTR